MSQDQDQIERLRLAIAENEFKQQRTPELATQLEGDRQTMLMLLNAMETAVNPIIPEGETL